MLTARRFVLAAAVVTLLAGASYARGAPRQNPAYGPLAIQVHPKRPNIVYASFIGSGVMKSTDAGQTWTAANKGLTTPSGSSVTRVDALALDAGSPNVLYAGTGLGVFKTSNGARTWKLASNGIDLPVGLSNRLVEGSIWGLAIDPLHTSTVYAINRMNGLWKSTNGGVTWRNLVAAGISFGSVASDPRRPRTVYASTSTDTAVSGGSIHKTVDGGGSWRATGPTDLVDIHFDAIVIARRAPGIVYAGGRRGFFASANQGRTWSKLLSLGVTAIALDPVRANVLYVGTVRSGLRKSVDGGQTWSALRLAARQSYVTAIAIDPMNPQTIYAGVTTNTGTLAASGDMFVSMDGGATWRRLF
jgi:photosystem II stability/assembly factor-like uncharacterized protein